jgi:hypothetical protein
MHCLSLRSVLKVDLPQALSAALAGIMRISKAADGRGIERKRERERGGGGGGIPP